MSKENIQLGDFRVVSSLDAQTYTTVMAAQKKAMQYFDGQKDKKMSKANKRKSSADLQISVVEGTFRHAGGMRNINQRSIQNIYLRKQKGELKGLKLREGDGFEQSSGVFVNFVGIGSMAELQGLRVGDEILAVNDIDVTTKGVAYVDLLISISDFVTLSYKKPDATDVFSRSILTDIGAGDISDSVEGVPLPPNEATRVQNHESVRLLSVRSPHNKAKSATPSQSGPARADGVGAEEAGFISSDAESSSSDEDDDEDDDDENSNITTADLAGNRNSGQQVNDGSLEKGSPDPNANQAPLPSTTPSVTSAGMHQSEKASGKSAPTSSEQGTPGLAKPPKSSKSPGSSSKGRSSDSNKARAGLAHPKQQSSRQRGRRSEGSKSGRRAADSSSRGKSSDSETESDLDPSNSDPTTIANTIVNGFSPTRAKLDSYKSRAKKSESSKRVHFAVPQSPSLDAKPLKPSLKKTPRANTASTGRGNNSADAKGRLKGRKQRPQPLPQELSQDSPIAQQGMQAGTKGDAYRKPHESSTAPPAKRVTGSKEPATQQGGVQDDSNANPSSLGLNASRPSLERQPAHVGFTDDDTHGPSDGDSDARLAEDKTPTNSQVTSAQASFIGRDRKTSSLDDDVIAATASKESFYGDVDLTASLPATLSAQGSFNSSEWLPELGNTRASSSQYGYGSATGTTPSLFSFDQQTTSSVVSSEGISPMPQPSFAQQVPHTLSPSSPSRYAQLSPNPYFGFDVTSPSHHQHQQQFSYPPLPVSPSSQLLQMRLQQLRNEELLFQQQQQQWQQQQQFEFHHQQQHQRQQQENQLLASQFEEEAEEEEEKSENTSSNRSSVLMSTEIETIPRSSNYPSTHGVIYTVTLPKAKGGLGLRIVGGADTTFGALFVSHLLEDGPAVESGMVEVGDRFVSVEGEDTLAMTQTEFKSVVKSAVGDVTFAFMRIGARQWKSICLQAGVSEQDFLDGRLVNNGTGAANFDAPVSLNASARGAKTLAPPSSSSGNERVEEFSRRLPSHPSPQRRQNSWNSLRSNPSTESLGVRPPQAPLSYVKSSIDSARNAHRVSEERLWQEEQEMERKQQRLERLKALVQMESSEEGDEESAVVAEKAGLSEEEFSRSHVHERMARLKESLRTGRSNSVSNDFSAATMKPGHASLLRGRRSSLHTSSSTSLLESARSTGSPFTSGSSDERYHRIRGATGVNGGPLSAKSKMRQKLDSLAFSYASANEVSEQPRRQSSFSQLVQGKSHSHHQHRQRTLLGSPSRHGSLSARHTADTSMGSYDGPQRDITDYTKLARSMLRTEASDDEDEEDEDDVVQKGSRLSSARLHSSTRASTSQYPRYATTTTTAEPLRSRLAPSTLPPEMAATANSNTTTRRLPTPPEK